MKCRQCGVEIGNIILGSSQCPICGLGLDGAKQDSGEGQSPNTPTAKKKEITLNLIFGWAFGILFIIAAIGGAATGRLLSISYLMAACAILPPAVKAMEDKLNTRLSKGVRAAIVILSLLAPAFYAQPIHQSAQAETARHPKAEAPREVNPVRPLPRAVRPQDTPQVPAAELNATQLAEANKENEARADSLYKGKLLCVTGVVSSIDKDFLDNTVVMMKGANQFLGVHANIKKGEEQKAINLNKGATVTVLCLGHGEVVGSPMLEGCTIL